MKGPDLPTCQTDAGADVRSMGRSVMDMAHSDKLGEGVLVLFQVEFGRDVRQALVVGL